MILRLTKKDYDAMVRLWEATGLEYRPLGRDSRESVVKQMRNNPDMYYGYFNNAGLIGSIIITNDGRKGWINRIAVHPDYRQTGIAGQLLKFGEEFLVSQGIQIAAALIYDYNSPSLALFESSGYEICSDIVYLRKKFQENI